MDSIKKTIQQVQPSKKTFQNTLDEETTICDHGKELRVGKHGVCYWECSLCDKEVQEKEKQKDMALKKEHEFKNTMYELKPYSNIPKRFISKTLDNYVADNNQKESILAICKQFVANFDTILDNGTSLMFCGKPGTGKTHLAYGMIQELLKQKKVSLLITASDMTGRVKSGYSTDSTKTPEALIEEFCKIDFLVIDEVGVQVDSDAEKRIFFNVINKRYEEMLPTVLISNLILDELSKFIGERVVDRMNENGGAVFGFDWKSYRK